MRDEGRGDGMGEEMNGVVLLVVGGVWLMLCV